MNEQAPQSTPVPTMDISQIMALEKKLRENKAAQLRGEPLPHEVKPEDIRAAVSAMRQSRGTLNLAEGRTAGTSTRKKSGGSAKIEIIDDL